MKPAEVIIHAVLKETLYIKESKVQAHRLRYLCVYISARYPVSRYKPMRPEGELFSSPSSKPLQCPIQAQKIVLTRMSIQTPR